MSTVQPQIGDIVRIKAVGPDLDILKLILNDVASETPQDVLTPLDGLAGAPQHDFGLVELVQEFVVATASGVTGAGIVEAVRMIVGKVRRKPTDVSRDSSSDVSSDASSDVVATVEAGETRGGVTEIIIRVKRE